MCSITSLAPILQQHLTDTAEAAARASGCVQRVRRFTGATLIQTLVFGWLEDPDASLSALCQLAAVRGVTISPQGLAQRFGRPLAEALEAVLAALVDEVVVGPPVAIPLLARFDHVWVLDTTVVRLPAALAARWPGCGGHPGHGAAALKVALALDLVSGQLHGPLLHAGRTADRATPLLAAPPSPGSLSVRDLGFFSLAQLARETAAGGHWLTRLMAGTQLRTADGQLTSQLAVLASQPGAVVELPVTLGRTAQLPARLLATRVPAEVAAARRHRLQRAAQTTRQPLRAARAALADWTLLVTDQACTLSHAEAQALARARWQIEQLIDRWKTLGGLARSRSQDPWRILCELYAKLIGLVISHWLALHGDWSAPDHSLDKAHHVVRRSSRMLAAVIDRPRRLRETLRTIGQCLAQAGRLNRRRAHPNTCQRLLDPVGTALT
jgi:hypothetical protein